MKVTEELLKKYNVPVPRYTSYPPANHFSASFGERDYIEMLRDSNTRQPEKIAIYIHVPFCKRICYYCGCNSCHIGNGSQVAPYFEALEQEIRLVSRYIDKSRAVSQVHFGGGTPNAVSFSLLESIIGLLRSEFSFEKNPEIAIECDPASLDINYIDNLIAAGFNRISFGIQDFNTEVLSLVNRRPPAVPPADLLKHIKSVKPGTGVNFDFIYGLPGQSVESFARTMEMAAGMRPDRLVTFSYAHVPWVKKHQVILEKRGLPSAEEKTNMFLAAHDIMTHAGYEPIGLDHFVLPSDDLFTAFTAGTLHRNFQGYCTRKTTGQVYAFGVTAISQLADGYAQNIKDIGEYISQTEKGTLPAERGYILSPGQKLAKRVITDLMCNKRVSFPETAAACNVDEDTLLRSVRIDGKVLGDLQDDGLITYTKNEIKVTEDGSFFIRNVAAALDPEYREAVQTYSKPV
jgi:oxygen-independent coproporphyrinogen-3 oxidase